MYNGGMKKVTYILGIIGLLVAGGLMVGTGASAETQSESATVQFTFASKVEVDIPTTALNMTMDGGALLPGSVAMSPSDWAITVSSNDTNGYTILASVGTEGVTSADMYRTKDSKNEDVTDTENKFTSLASDASLAELTQGYWGYRISTDGGTTFGNYSGLKPYNATDDQGNAKVVREASKTDTTTTNFQIAAYAADDQTPGTYSTTINFYVVPGVDDGSAGGGV